MNTVNVPIEFKQINPDDFDSNYNVSPKQIILPNGDGYINDALMPILDSSRDEKNTVVINAGVGQGKSYSIIDMATKYAVDDKYIVIIAVPFNSLIEQYYQECSNKYPEDKILNTLELKELVFPNLGETGYGYMPMEFEYFNFDIHIMTIHALLGNSGEDVLFQAKERIIYFDKLRKYCKDSNKEIVLIFDEIHDGLLNFKEKYIYKLWSFQGLIHKIFILSATFNEASKEVIKYLSEFTDKKIQLIESERLIIPEKQSRLHLNFYLENKIQNVEILFALISELIKKDNNFDILLYSQTQAIKILEEKYFENPNDKTKFVSLLSLYKGRINLCYSDPFNTKANKKYDESKINIGTNFRTGISIKKENHSFIVILPKELSIKYLNNKGVFTDGYNSIIQAIARQRVVGDIYMFLPQPAEIELNSLPYSNSENEIIYSEFEIYKNSQKKPVDYSNINKQDLLLKKTYKNLSAQVSKGIKTIIETDRAEMNRLIFPTQEIFNLDNGEKYLSQNFFGGDISSFVFWASICNQFLNCKLQSITSNKNLHLESENLFDEIVRIKDENIISYHLVDYNLIYLNGNDKYLLMSNVYSYLFEEIQLTIDGVFIDNKKTQEIKLMVLKSIIDRNSTSFNLKEDKKLIYHYYLKSSLFYATHFIVNSYEERVLSIYSEDTLRVIELYNSWLEFILILENSKKKRVDNFILPTKPTEEFIQLFIEKNFEHELNELIEKDILLKTGMFPFKDSIKKNINQREKSINFFYKLLVNILYKGALTHYVVNGRRKRWYKLNETDLYEGKYYNLLYRQVPLLIDPQELMF